MSAARRVFTPAEHIFLVTQASNRCPACADPIFYKKGLGAYKNYEVAHIYPLNPTSAEEALLANEERLSKDPNHIDNVVALCERCHGKFDKPRTVSEYREMVRLKRELIARSQQQEIQAQYQIERDISKVLHSLYSEDIQPEDADLALSPKNIDAKLDSTMSRPTRRKIQLNVQHYFIYVRRQFGDLERETHSADLIAAQVRAYYLAQKKLGLTQQQIFSNIVDWLVARTHPSMLDAAEIIASFFVQNCEIFE